VNVVDLEPRLHEPPAGWSVETFEQVTNALAAALVRVCERRLESDAIEGTGEGS
jgi:hypothetical protein